MFQCNAKPTIRTSDVAAMRAVQQWNDYRVTRTATGWTVLHVETEKEYHVGVDGSCDCPHFVNRLRHTGDVCKHYNRACLEERLTSAAPQRAPSNWDLAQLREGWEQPNTTLVCPPDMDTRRYREALCWSVTDWGNDVWTLTPKDGGHSFRVVGQECSCGAASGRGRRSLFPCAHGRVLFTHLILREYAAHSQRLTDAGVMACAGS